MYQAIKELLYYGSFEEQADAAKAAQVMGRRLGKHHMREELVGPHEGFEFYTKCNQGSHQQNNRNH